MTIGRDDKKASNDILYALYFPFIIFLVMIKKNVIKYVSSKDVWYTNKGFIIRDKIIDAYKISRDVTNLLYLLFKIIKIIIIEALSIDIEKLVNTI